MRELNNMEEIEDYLNPEVLFKVISICEKHHAETGAHFVIVATDGALCSGSEKSMKEKYPTDMIIYNTRYKVIPEWYIKAYERPNLRTK